MPVLQTGGGVQILTGPLGRRLPASVPGGADEGCASPPAGVRLSLAPPEPTRFSWQRGLGSGRSPYEAEAPVQLGRCHRRHGATASMDGLRPSDAGSSPAGGTPHLLVHTELVVLGVEHDPRVMLRLVPDLLLRSPEADEPRNLRVDAPAALLNRDAPAATRAHVQVQAVFPGLRRVHALEVDPRPLPLRVDDVAPVVPLLAR